MLKKLHDAAKAVLALRDGQHSQGHEIDAFQALEDAIAGAAAELKATKKAAVPKAKPAAKAAKAKPAKPAAKKA